jgi:nucleoside-diphosphate-sugar epimerase
MRILITGHEGFIGRHVFKHFSKQHECIGLDIKSGGDILTSPLPGCDAIIHLAALAGVRKSRENPDMYWRVNVEGSYRVFAHASSLGIKVLYASSSSVKQWMLSPYATTKKVVELIAPPKSLGMRFHTVYGKDSRPDMMYDMLLNNTATYVTDHTRDFTHVDDVVSAIDLLFRVGVCGIVDIGSDNPVSVRALARSAGRYLPTKQVSGEQTSSHADISLLRSLGWQPTRDVLVDIRNDLF